MPTNPQLTATDRPANWPAITLEQIRLVRTLKNEYAAVDELLSITLGMLREATLELNRVRDELRRVTGRPSPPDLARAA